MTTATPGVSQALEQVQAAASGGKITSSAADNIRVWLTEARYASYAPQIIEHVVAGKWKELDDVFWTVIPFGTGGRRGRMYPFGSNAINERTIGESAQGLADYVRETLGAGAQLSCAIAYDTRHRSREFAELCAEIMAAAGFTVWFLDGYRSTPELSFCVRHKQCSCGIMVTASHNPPSDNAVKVYWSTGGQVLPPHDQGVIDRVMSVNEIRRTPFADARAAGKIRYCQDEIDAAYHAAVLAQKCPGPRNLKIIYSPMHGVGGAAVMPILAADGFDDVELFGPHAQPDGDFPNVPGHVSNPENPATFDIIIQRAESTGAELILSTDPDADRLGCAAPLSAKQMDQWRTFTGNQIGALLVDHLLAERKKAGMLGKDSYVVKTLVTSEMIRRIADSYGVRTIGDLMVGFKYIGAAIDKNGPDGFVFGAEESHGFLSGTYARDKDGPLSAMLLAELGARLKAAGKSLHEQLDALYWQHGCHAESTVSKTMPGSQGMQRMHALMQALRTRPPERLGAHRVAAVRDYSQGTVRTADGKSQPLVGPRGDVVVLDLEAEGNYVAVRPSGTEPKVKFYAFAYEPAEQLANLETAKSDLAARLKEMAEGLGAFADRV